MEGAGVYLIIISFSRLIESTCCIMKFFPCFVHAQKAGIKRDINVLNELEREEGKWEKRTKREERILARTVTISGRLESKEIFYTAEQSDV